MGGRASCWHYAIYILVTEWLLLASVQASLVPFTIRPAGREIERRSLSQQADILKPRHEVELPYANNNPLDQQYVAIVTTQHRSRPYILVEEFEDTLSMIECSSNDSNGFTRLAIKFRERNIFAMAKDSWSRYEALTFITHHPSCNDDPEERAVYISSSIQFDEHNLMVVIRCHPTIFGPSKEASTSISFRGGIAPEELSKRLRRRHFRGRDKPQKRDISTYTFSLDEEIWAERELLFGLGPFEMNCVECRWTGELAAAFNFRIPDTDRMDRLSNEVDANSLRNLVDVTEVRLQNTRPIEANMNLELIASGGIKFTFPGLAAGVKEPKFGSKMVKKKKKRFFKFGNWSILGTYRYGVSVGVEFYGAVQAVLPITTSIPAGQGVTMNFANPLASSSSFRPAISVDKPQKLSLLDPESRFSVGIGPGLELTLEASAPLGQRGAKFSFVFQTGIEAPKLETRFVGKSGVDEKCKPGGSLGYAIQEKTKVGVGLKLEAWFNAEKDGYPIPRAPLYKWDLGGLLHPSWTVDDRCFDMRRLFLPGSVSEPGRGPGPPETENRPPSPSAGSESPAAGASKAPDSNNYENPVFKVDPSAPFRIRPWGSKVSRLPASKAS